MTGSIVTTTAEDFRPIENFCASMSASALAYESSTCDSMTMARSTSCSCLLYTSMEEAPEEMAFLGQFVDKGLLERLMLVAGSEFARVTYTEAIDILQKSGAAFEYPVSWGCDLQTEHERYLTEKHFGRPVFVYDYPKEIKAFYMRQNDDGKTVAAADLLVPGIGELIGGSQREERLDVLEARMDELKLDKESYWWYMEMRKYCLLYTSRCV